MQAKNPLNPLFVTGIGTGVGKTVVAAIITEQLKADYWKPVQAGDLDRSDSHRVRSLISNRFSKIHPEKFKLKLAASPHKAAALEGKKISAEDFNLPQTNNRLVVEGAGGLMVPLSKDMLMIDLIQKLDAEIILVIRDYLGCINHTLLSYELLCAKRCKLKAIVFNGLIDKTTETAICDYISPKIELFHVPEMISLTKHSIKQLNPLFKS